MEKMYEIINDMDLALEGVPFSENNKNIIQGLAILEHQNPNFCYSKPDLTLNEKVAEMRIYYFNNGYANNNEILEQLNKYSIGLLK